MNSVSQSISALCSRPWLLQGGGDHSATTRMRVQALLQMMMSCTGDSHLLMCFFCLPLLLSGGGDTLVTSEI
jgi:hypothetical protein